jgi:hypothetical protein
VKPTLAAAAWVMPSSSGWDDGVIQTSKINNQFSIVDF